MGEEKLLKKIYESKEYLKLRLDESERRNRCLINKLAISMAEAESLHEDVYRLEATVECYREQLVNANVIPKSVTPDFGQKYIEYLIFKRQRTDDAKIELFKQKIEELEY